MRLYRFVYVSIRVFGRQAVLKLQFIVIGGKANSTEVF